MHYKLAPVLLCTLPLVGTTTPSCIPLSTLHIQEKTILSTAEKERLTQAYKNQCISVDLLKDVLSTLTNHYTTQGYITTKPYLKKQNILDGSVDIDVAIGRVEDILHAETNSTSAKITLAFIGQKDEILNLRHLETALESINRVPSSDATFALHPGRNIGGSIVKIATKKDRPYHLTLGVSGSERFKDKNRYLTAILSLDNPLGINDILTYRHNGTQIQQEYQSSKGDELNYSFPIGSYLFEFIHSRSSYRQGVEGINATYLSKGITKGKSIKISKMLTRNQRNKLNLTLSLNHSSSKNYFNDSLVEVSSYKTTKAHIDLAHTHLY
jgi:hemolysin activation/secretion protein